MGEGLAEGVVDPHAVNLHYLSVVKKGLLSGKLAETTHLCTSKVKISTDEGVMVPRGATIEIVKKGGWFTPSKGRVKGMKKLIGVSTRKVERKARSEWTIDDVREYFVKERVGDASKPLASVLEKDHQVCSEEYTGMFVTAPGDVSFVKLVEALESHFENEDPKKVFLWLELFNVNPLESDEKSTQAFELNLPSFLPKFEKHLVYFDNWTKGGIDSSSSSNTNITALSSIKCLWEVFVAHEAGMFSSVVMTKADQMRLRDSFQEGGLAYFETLLRKIFVPEESPEAPYIQTLVKTVTDGKSGFVRAVRKQYELWFIHVFTEELTGRKNRQDVTLYEQAALDVNRVAVIYSRKGDLVRAEALFRDVIDLQTKGKGELDPATANAKNNLALLLMKQGKLEEAKELLEDAIDALKQQDMSKDPKLEGCLAIMEGNLSNVYERLGQLDNAIATRKQLLELRIDEYGRESTQAARVLNALGALHMKNGDVASAKEALLEALGIWEKNPSADMDKLDDIVDNLAHAYHLESEHDHPDHGGEHEVNIAKTLKNLALLYRSNLEDTEKESQDLADEDASTVASEYGSKAVQVLEEVLGKDHPESQKYRQELLEIDEDQVDIEADDDDDDDNDK